MRINKTDNILNVYNTKLNTKGGKIQTKKEDKIELSKEALSFKFSFEKLRGSPEIRQSKVDSIKAKVDSGTYNVSSEQIAEKMLNQVDLKKEFHSW